jgi:hypothetical protein
MNRLRDPKVLIGLGVLVVALAGIAYWLYFGRPVRKSRSPAAAGNKAAGPAAGLTRSPTNAIRPDAAIDLDYVQTNLARWLEAPQRDPFQLSEPVVTTAAAPTYSPVNQLKLNAVWRQSGGSAAVINGRIVEQGGTIEGLTLERIEADRVWLKGPEKIESLAFGQVPLPPPPPPQPLTKKLKGMFGSEVTPAPKPRL